MELAAGDGAHRGVAAGAVAYACLVAAETLGIATAASSFHLSATTTAMTLLGIELRKPSFNEITAAAVMATGLWLAGIGMARASGQPFDAGDAGAFLVLCAWGCLGARLGLSIDSGRRHLAANVAVSAFLLALYQTARVLTT